MTNIPFYILVVSRRQPNNREDSRSPCTYFGVSSISRLFSLFGLVKSGPSIDQTDGDQRSDIPRTQIFLDASSRQPELCSAMPLSSPVASKSCNHQNEQANPEKRVENRHT